MGTAFHVRQHETVRILCRYYPFSEGICINFIKNKIYSGRVFRYSMDRKLKLIFKKYLNVDYLTQLKCYLFRMSDIY